MDMNEHRNEMASDGAKMEGRDDETPIVASKTMKGRQKVTGDDIKQASVADSKRRKVRSKAKAIRVTDDDTPKTGRVHPIDPKAVTDAMASITQTELGERLSMRGIIAMTEYLHGLMVPDAIGDDGKFAFYSAQGYANGILVSAIPLLGQRRGSQRSYLRRRFIGTIDDMVSNVSGNPTLDTMRADGLFAASFERGYNDGVRLIENSDSTERLLISGDDRDEATRTLLGIALSSAVISMIAGSIGAYELLDDVDNHHDPVVDARLLALREVDRVCNNTMSTYGHSLRADDDDMTLVCGVGSVAAWHLHLQTRTLQMAVHKSAEHVRTYICDEIIPLMPACTAKSPSIACTVVNYAYGYIKAMLEDMGATTSDMLIVPNAPNGIDKGTKKALDSCAKRLTDDTAIAGRALELTLRQYAWTDGMPEKRTDYSFLLAGAIAYMKSSITKVTRENAGEP